MNPDFWRERWQRNEIGFHRPDINSWLVRHADALGVAPGRRVFVPLCGKTLDLGWLAARGCAVTGVELSELAVAAYFAEAGTRPQRATTGRLEAWTAGAVRLLCGDFFALDRATLGGIDAVFDRAALVALPPAMRADYARHLATLLDAGTRVLLVTFDYDQSRMAGPPFCVPADEVRTLFAHAFDIVALGDEDILAGEPRFRARGLDRLHEQGWLLTRR